MTKKINNILNKTASFLAEIQTDSNINDVSAMAQDLAEEVKEAIDDDTYNEIVGIFGQALDSNVYDGTDKRVAITVSQSLNSFLRIVYGESFDDYPDIQEYCTNNIKNIDEIHDCVIAYCTYLDELDIDRHSAECEEERANQEAKEQECCCDGEYTVAEDDEPTEYELEVDSYCDLVEEEPEDEENVNEEVEATKNAISIPGFEETEKELEQLTIRHRSALPIGDDNEK